MKRPVSPEIGAVIEAYWRLRRAVATAAESARTVAIQVSAAVRTWSQSDWEMRFCSLSGWLRVRLMCAVSACARSLARVAAASSSAARDGRGPGGAAQRRYEGWARPWPLQHPRKARVRRN